MYETASSSLRRDQTLPLIAHSQRRFFLHAWGIDCVAHDDLDASGTTATQARRDADCPSPAGGTISPRLEESYGYDDLDRLSGYHAYAAGVQSDSGQWTYDALDRVSSEQETHSVGSVNRSMSFEYIGLSDDAAKETWTGSGATTRNYTYDAGGNKVGVTDTSRNTNLLYGYNTHGDVSQLITSTGTAQAAYGYRPYGDEEQGSNALSQGDTGTQTAAGPQNNYRYSAKRFDTANKQLNMGARFFSPDYGTFIQEDFLRDSLGDLDLATDPLTGTRYGLAGGNPVNFVEVDGHSSIFTDGGSGAPWRRVIDLPPGYGIDLPVQETDDLELVAGLGGLGKALIKRLVRKLGKTAARELIERRNAERSALRRILKRARNSTEAFAATFIFRNPARAAAIIAKGEAANGRRYLEKFMTPGQLRAYHRNPAKGSRWLGHALRRATYERLRALFGRRFRYNPTHGPDFLDTRTGRYIELTTSGQLRRHIRRYRNFQHAIDFIVEDIPRFQ